MVVPARRTQDDQARLGATSDARVVGVFLNGDGDRRAETPHGEPIVDDSFLLLFNAHHEDVDFMLPPRRFGVAWSLELSTAEPEVEEGAWSVAARETVHVAARSIVVLRRPADPS